MKRARTAPILMLLALAGAGLGAPARPALAAPASWESAVDELASSDPKVRTEAAKRLGAAWPEGTMAAPVLVEVAAWDGDPGVRQAAAKAIEALGASALPVLVRLLEGAKGGAPEMFHEFAEQFVRLGPKCSTTDFSAALHYAIEDAPSDEGQAAVLMAVPLLVAPGDVTRRPALLALDLVLEDRVRLGGPKAREVAAAGLALYASAALRDRGTYASGVIAMPPASQAALFALLEHQTPHMAVSACAVLGALGGASPDVVKALTPSSATPDKTTIAKMAALGRMGPAARTAVPVLRQLSREEPAGALAALVKVGERTKLLPEEPESVAASLQKASAEPLAATRVRELERFIDAARELALVDATLAEPARSALWTLVLRRVTAAEYHLSNRAYEALERLGPLDSATDRQLGANAPAKGLQPAIRLRMLAGSDPLGLLASALDPVNELASHDVAFWLPVGIRIGARGAVTPPTFARKDLPESLRLGLLRGYADPGTPDPARIEQALETLRDGERETQALAAGQFVKQVVGAGRPAPRGEVAREPILRAEMRVAAVDVLRTQGAATASAKSTLEALRTDPDPRVRWRARRALGSPTAPPAPAPTRPDPVAPPVPAVLPPVRPVGPQAAWEKAVDDLASPDAKVRADAAKRLGAAWPDGAMAAPVLVDVSAMDDDGAVRTAAIQAIEALGAKALAVWAKALKGAAGGKPKEFHEVAREMVLLGAKVTTTDLCAGLAWTIEKGTPEGQAGVLLTVPLAVARRDDGTMPRLGLDLMLEDRMLRGGPKVAEVAAAGLVLLANVALRDRPAYTPSTTGADAASLATLLALLKDEREWMPPVVLALLGGLGAPTPEVVKALTPKVAEPTEVQIVGVGRLGPAARSAVPDIAELARNEVAGTTETLVRLGERKELFAEPKGVAERVAKAGKAVNDPEWRGPLRWYGDVARALARLDPGLAEPMRPALWAIVRSGAHSVGSTLLALKELGPLQPEDERWLVEKVEAQELGAFFIALLIVAGSSDQAARLPSLLEPDSERKLEPQFDEWWLAIGMRLGKTGVVPSSLLARRDLPEAFRIGVLRGYASAPSPKAERLEQAIAVLGDTGKESATLAQGGIVKAVAGTFESPPYPEIAPTAQRRLEMRVRAVEVIEHQGSAAKAAVPTLQALLQDPDPRVRWRAHRALRAIK